MEIGTPELIKTVCLKSLSLKIGRKNKTNYVFSIQFLNLKLIMSKITSDPLNIENGMDVNKCAKVIVNNMNKGVREIAVGEGMSLLALKIKRFMPNKLFDIMANQP